MSGTAEVVGASGAMGQFIARKMAARGLTVVAVARSEAALHALAETAQQKIIPRV